MSNYGTVIVPPDHKASDFKWSFSAWATYNTCPAKYKFKYDQRLKGLPPGPAAARGIEMHDSIDLYIRAEVHDPEKLHPAIDKETMLPIFDLFRNHGNGERFTELPVYTTEDWKDTLKAFRWCTSIFDAVRAGGDWQLEKGVVDPHEKVVSVAEWKSGSPKDDHKDQRHLYATTALSRFHYYDEVRVTTYYVEGKFPPARLSVKRSAQEKLQDLWNGRIKGIRNDEFKAPRPGMYCRWCDYAKDRGGPCTF